MKKKTADRSTVSARSMGSTPSRANDKEQQEAEANIFACLLLMPEGIFEEEFNTALRSHWEKPVLYLRNRFQVPEFAVMMRISLMNKLKA